MISFVAFFAFVKLNGLLPMLDFVMLTLGDKIFIVAVVLGVFTGSVDDAVVCGAERGEIGGTERGEILLSFDLLFMKIDFFISSFLARSSSEITLSASLSNLRFQNFPIMSMTYKPFLLPNV